MTKWRGRHVHGKEGSCFSRRKVAGAAGPRSTFVYDKIHRLDTGDHWTTDNEIFRTS